MNSPWQAPAAVTESGATEDRSPGAHEENRTSEGARLRRACVRVVACFAFVCVYFVGIYPGAADANQRSHFQLLRALAERGSAEIEPELRDFGSHTDVAVHAGHHYSDKAPGLSLAAVPGYGLIRLVLPAPTSTQDWLVFYGARLFSVTLVVVLALAVFVRQATRIVPSSPLLPIWLFALLFATPFQVYARSFFSHAFVAALLYLSFVLLVRHDSAPTAVGSGLLAGAAVASEYPVAVIALCLLAAAAVKGPAKRTALFVLGAAVPAAMLAWYHARFFGSVLAFPYMASETYAILLRRGVVGVSWPSLSALAGLFLDPAHGLLYFSPFMILWPLGAILFVPTLRRDPASLVPAVGPLLLLLVIAGYVPPHWRGGWCLGPRYLVAGFLLVFWLLVDRIPEASRPRARIPLLAAIVYGTAILAVCGSTFWMIPYESWNPVRTVSAYFLKRGVVEFNLGVASGVPPLLSLLPPLLACAVAFVSAVHGARIRGGMLAAAGVLGLFAFGVLLLIPPSQQAIDNSHRDGLASVLLPTMRSGWR